VTDCNVIKINRVSLAQLIRDDASLARRVYWNVMLNLRRQLVTANEKIDQLKQVVVQGDTGYYHWQGSPR
jgi:hypothetical protein